MLKNRFFFQGFTPSTELKDYANRRLSELRTLLPPDGIFIALLEQTNEGVYVAIEVCSKHQSFFEEALSFEPRTAVERALFKIEDRLFRWRYGPRREEQPVAVTPDKEKAR